MPYRLRRREPVPQGLARIVREQIGSAVEELTDPQMDRHEAVHQVRKRFKKIRAVLRLVRFELGDVYVEQNAWFRDTARTLSYVRDAEAMAGTLDALFERFAGEVAPGALSGVREALVERRRRIADEEVSLDARIVQLVKDLRAVRRGVGKWPLEADGFDALRRGLVQTYRRGRRAMKEVNRAPMPENFHEWRKRVKYHWYHCRVLRNIWPRMMDPLRKSAHRLADLLGDYHDLDVLRQTLKGEADAFAGRSGLPLLMDLIDRRQAELAARAQRLGHSVFAEKPGAFCRRMAAYWEVWKARPAGRRRGARRSR